MTVPIGIYLIRVCCQRIIVGGICDMIIVF